MTKVHRRSNHYTAPETIKRWLMVSTSIRL